MAMLFLCNVLYKTRTQHHYAPEIANTAGGAGMERREYAGCSAPGHNGELSD